MPFTTWIRDLFGIRKDVIDTEKTKLEITKLEAEERERNLITPASLDDVVKYDPKTSELLHKVIRFVIHILAFIGLTSLFVFSFDSELRQAVWKLFK